MTGPEKFVAALVGAILVLSALCAGGQPSPKVAEDTRQDTSPLLASTAKRTPADMPPNPPKVTCDGGSLTISALNSTLGAVLNAIRNCTGAAIDVPEDARGERLFAELGPGPVRAVLAEFLSSTDFNYVIKASPSDPQKVQTVLLNPRATDSTTEVASQVASEVANDGSLSPNRRAWLEARRNYLLSVAPPEDQSSQESDTTAPASAPVETAAAPANAIPVEAAPADSAAAVSAVAPPAVSAMTSAPGEPSSAQSEGKSTQEMIGDMQRMFEQRKQMVQQQTATVH